MNDLSSLKQRSFPFQTVIALFFLFFAVFGTPNLRATSLGYFFSIFGVFIGFLLHEIGHLIAGFAVRYRFWIFAVSYLHIYREQNQLRLGWKRFLGQPTALTGLTVFLVDDYVDFRRRMFWYIFGGPLLNAIVLLVVIWLYTGIFKSSDNRHFMTEPLLWAGHNISFGALVGSAFMLLVSMYPSKWTSTDGNRLQRLLRGGTVLERYEAQVRIANTNLQGIRPRDWDATWITHPIMKDDASVDMVTSYFYAYRWALDRGDEQQAERYLTGAVRLRQKLSPRDRANLLVEAAYFELRYHANMTNAERWIDILGNDKRRAHVLYQLKLACVSSLSLHQYTQVQQYAAQALQIIDDLKVKDGLTIMERDLILDLLERAKQGLQTNLESGT